MRRHLGWRGRCGGRRAAHCGLLLRELEQLRRSTSSSSGTGSASAAARAGDRAAWLPGEHHPRARADRGEERLLHQGARHRAGTVTTTVFTSGTQETTAILAGQLDAAYVGPNPAINAWQKSGGTAIKIVSGVATGGASIVVKPSITVRRAAQGAVARHPVARQHPGRGGALLAQAAGADHQRHRRRRRARSSRPRRTPPPCSSSSRARSPAPPSRRRTTWRWCRTAARCCSPSRARRPLLMVTQSFLSAHPAIVADLLKANLDALNYIKSDPLGAEAAANAELAAYTGKPLSATVIGPAFKEITFTDDPDAASLTQDAQQATSGRAAQDGQPERDLRPGPAQHDPHRDRPPTVSAASSREPRPATGGPWHGSDNSAAGKITEPPCPPHGNGGRGGHAWPASPRCTAAAAPPSAPSTRCPSPSQPGEFTCLIGASGCGKSTLLSLVAGLDRPTSGDIAVARPGRRSCSRSPACSPGSPPAANVELALRARKVPRAERKASGRRSCSTPCTSAASAAKRPHELSGGMRQRVALARALAQDADVLLMDEPFGALDAMTRDLLHDELDRVRERVGKGLTVLFVTAQRPRGGPPRRPRGPAVQPSGPGHRGVPGARRAAAADRLRPGRRAGQRHHRPAARGGKPSWQLTRLSPGSTPSNSPPPREA